MPVVHIGARRGLACPDARWLYIPRSEHGSRRVGFTSNVDPGLLPAGARRDGDRAGANVERPFRAGARPGPAEGGRRVAGVIEELRGSGLIGQVDGAHADRIEVACTWSRPVSTWRMEALDALRKKGIHQIGRDGRRQFQGITDSSRDGFVAGSALRPWTR